MVQDRRIHYIQDFLKRETTSILGYTPDVINAVDKFIATREDTYDYIDLDLADRLAHISSGSSMYNSNFDIFKACLKRATLVQKKPEQINEFIEDMVKYCYLVAIGLSRETLDFLTYYANRTSFELPDDIRCSHDAHFGDNRIQTGDFLHELSIAITYLGKDIKLKLIKSGYGTYNSNLMVLQLLRQLYKKCSRSRARKITLLTGDPKNPETMALNFVMWATPAFEIINRNYDLVVSDRKKTKVILNMADRYGYNSKEFLEALDKAGRKVDRKSVLERRAKYKYITRNIMSDEVLMSLSLSQLADINFGIKNSESSGKTVQKIYDFIEQNKRL